MFVALFLAKKTKNGWRLIFTGAAVWAGIQVSRVILYWLFILVSPNWQPFAKINNIPILILFSVFMGTQAGFLEGIGKYLIFRYNPQNTRTWLQAIAIGVGWGGMEVIVSGAYNLLSATLGNHGGSGAWFLLSCALLERVATFILHIAFCVLILQDFAQNRKIFLWAVILWHSSIDIWETFFIYQGEFLTAGSYLVVSAIFGLFIISQYRPVKNSLKAATA